MDPDLDLLYRSFVTDRFKRFPAHTDSILHATIGIAGEAGELLDCVKKTWAYGKPLDTAHLTEELGDLEFYLQALRTELGITRDAILRANIVKLQKRYPNGYSDEAAIARADKKGAQA